MIGLCVLALAACSHSTEGTGTAAGPAVASLTASGAEAVAVGTARSLSPDGAKVEFRGDNGLCVADVDGSHRTCLPADAKVDPAEAVAWSPDGAALVFTDSYFRDFREPDVWVMDTATGGVRNLTDDGVDAVRPGASDPAAAIDLFPQFSADGQSILFARQSAAAADRIDFMSMPADGGSPKAIASMALANQHLAGVSFSPDMTVIACAVYGDDYRHGALSLITPDGGAVAVGELPEYDNSVLSFSADGEYLLVDSAVPYGEVAHSIVDNAVVVRVSDRAVTPVASDVSAVMWPTWSPLGHGLAFVSGKPGAEQLRLAAQPGGTSRSVLDKQQLGAGGDRLSWSHADDVLVYVDAKPTVVQLGA